MKKWISVLYNNISSAVTQYGFLSDFFYIGRGCRQGDPSSSYIFSMCAEVLSLMLKQIRLLSELKYVMSSIFYHNFTDGTISILDGSEQPLAADIKTLDSFALRF